MKRYLGFLVCLLLGVVVMVTSSPAADAPAIVVGRIYDVEGDLLRYVPAESDWVAVVRDAPFGTDDTLYSGSRGMAELVAPNGTWIRVGNSTQIQFIALDADLSEVDVAAGVARFYNKSPSTVIKVTSPFGYVLAYTGDVFDFYVGENSVEVVPVRGTVSFVHAATNYRYDVATGSPSILADENQVSSGDGSVDPDWDRWNTGRESVWANKARVRGRSIEYLPPSLLNESYALEENGRWESVSYEGSPRWFWRPTRVAVGWSPFTMGRWTEWGGDQCWIPDEPFGYVTHHYGNWIYVRNAWYWAPPVAVVRAGLPLLNVGFFWYPGRVSWIHSGANVGWVPLAPRETYYSRRNWGGPHVMVVNNDNITRINVNVRYNAYADHAIVIPQSNLYRVNNYRDVRVPHLNVTTIINNYRAAPILNNAVISNYSTNNQRYNYTNARVNEKPHNTVINRIQQNETVIRGARKENALVLEQQMKRLPEGRINREARIEQPRMADRIVPASDVNKPKSEVKFEQKAIRGPGKGGLQAPPGRVGAPQAPPPQQPAARPEQVRPGQRPEQGPQSAQPSARPAPPTQVAPPQQPAARPERVTPPQAGPSPQPAARPEQVRPGQRPEQGPQSAQPSARPAPPTQVAPPQQPAARPERVTPPQAGPSPQPAARPEQVRPGQRPEQGPQSAQPSARPAPPTQVAPPQQPAARPERVTPPQAGPSPQPAARPDRLAPPQPTPQQPAARPAPPPQAAPPQQPVARPERVAPSPQQPVAKPAPPPQVAPPPPPAPRPERVAPPQAPPPQPAVKPAPPQQPVAKPAPPTQVAPPQPPVAKPEHVTPKKPGQPDKTEDEPGKQEKPRP